MIRCFKCPKERRGDDPGWYFMDLHDRRTGIARLRVYVCPRDYLPFAGSERTRWSPVQDLAARDVATPPADLPMLAGCGAADLIAALSLRGMTGWALLVRDVAEGRIRRLHLRRLPADPQIRQALVAYLQSAGAEITVSRTLVPESLGAVTGSPPASAE